EQGYVTARLEDPAQLKEGCVDVVEVFEYRKEEHGVELGIRKGRTPAKVPDDEAVPLDPAVLVILPIGDAGDFRRPLRLGEIQEVTLRIPDTENVLCCDGAVGREQLQ